MSVAYGALELKAGYQKGLTKAVFFAAGLHAAVIGGVLLYDYIRSLSAEDRGVMVISDVKPLPPPSLQNKPPILKVEPPKVKPPAVGVPKAIPDEVVVEQVTMASQKELSDLIPPVTEDGKIRVETPEPSIPNPDSFIDVDEEPVLIRQVKPAYPSLAYQNRIEGRVVVKILVDTDGKVLDIKIVQSSNEIFNEEAVAAAKQWAFKPAIQNKKPIRFWYIAPIVFKIE